MHVNVDLTEWRLGGSDERLEELCRGRWNLGSHSLGTKSESIDNSELGFMLARS